MVAERKSRLVAFRMTEEQARLLRKAAVRENRSVSNFVRHVMLREIERIVSAKAAA